jgi:hypothetical protein
MSNASSMIRAAISAPNPTVSGASCTTTARPVERTALPMASTSSGTRDRRSSTCASTPSSASRAAAARDFATIAPYVTIVTAPPSRTTRARPMGSPPP